MSVESLNTAAAQVLLQYPRPLWSGAPRTLGNHGGFSGARLWRLDGPAGSLCLRAWPAEFPPQRLDFIHQCMMQACKTGLAFVPRLFCTAAQTTRIAHAGRLWELQEWLPGDADYRLRPSPAKLRAALSALAQLHLCWQNFLPPVSGPYPAIARRWDIVHGWRELVKSGWRPAPRAGDPIWPAAERTWRLLPGRIDATHDLLKRWADRTWSLQPCLCDVWHDHVLYDGDRVTGLIDYRAMKIDHPAVDLARLLGSLAEDDAESWVIGLAAYRDVRPLSAEEAELARALDATGAIAAAAVWLRWLYHDRKEFEDRTAAGRRLEGIAARIERWHYGLYPKSVGKNSISS